LLKENSVSQTINVAYVAELALIALTPGEVESFQGQMDALVQCLGKIGEVDVSGVEPMIYGLPAVNVFREDTVEPSGMREQMLGLAPARNNNEFRLPKIVEEA
jgi:aspartyl-tRNA(Asn)/glutamyl-tRNA(Gln) amidotransferase subunit C